jgi:hypothetical protein
MHTLQQLIDNPSLLDGAKEGADAERARIEALEDDYWGRIGDLIEQHPIVGPRGKLLA